MELRRFSWDSQGFFGGWDPQDSRKDWRGTAPDPVFFCVAVTQRIHIDIVYIYRIA